MCSYSESEEWQLIKKERQEKKENDERLMAESEDSARDLHEDEETINQFKDIRDSEDFVFDACAVLNRIVWLKDYVDNQTIMSPSEMNREVSALKRALKSVSYDTKKVIGLDVLMQMEEKLKSYTPLSKIRGLLRHETVNESFKLFDKHSVDISNLVEFITNILDAIYGTRPPFDAKKAVYDYMNKPAKGVKLKIDS